jgi:hypothetical protein
MDRIDVTMPPCDHGSDAAIPATHPTCNHPSGCRRPSAREWGGFCVQCEARRAPPVKADPQTKPGATVPAPSRAPTSPRKPRAKAQPRIVRPPTRRRCLVETIVAMHAAGVRCLGDDIVLVAWARWPGHFSIAGTGTPSDHKVRSALSSVPGMVERTGWNLYAPTPAAKAYAAIGKPERDVVSVESAVVILRGVATGPRAFAFVADGE